jgi:hypothetical protein
MWHEWRKREIHTGFWWGNLTGRKEDEMGRVCGTNGGKEKYVRSFATVTYI